MGTRMLELLLVLLFAIGGLFILLKIMRSPKTEHRFEVKDQGQELWDEPIKEHPIEKEKHFYSFEEAMQVLQAKEETLKRLVSNGSIRAYRFGNKMRFKKEDVDTLLKDLKI